MLRLKMTFDAEHLLGIGKEINRVPRGGREEYGVSLEHLHLLLSN